MRQRYNWSDCRARGVIPVAVELLLDRAFRNIVEEGLDTGVWLGESVERDMIAVRIGPDWRMVAVTSPGYLAAHGVPEHRKIWLDKVIIEALRHRDRSAP